MRLLKSSQTPPNTSTGASPASILRAAPMMRPTESVGGAVAPPKPKFTILKRPSTSPSSLASLVNPGPSPFDDDKDTAESPSSTIDIGFKDQPTTAAARRPVKTLEQRKQEYAEARLRILGDAKFSDDDDDDDEVVEKKQQPTEAKTQNSGGNRNGGGSAGRGNKSGTSQYPPNSSRPPPQVPVFNPSVPPPRFDPVIRVPRGPDGSVGFQSRR